MRATGMWEIRRKIIRDTEAFLARHLSSGAPRDLVMRLAEEELDRTAETEAFQPRSAHTLSPAGRGDGRAGRGEFNG